MARFIKCNNLSSSGMDMPGRAFTAGQYRFELEGPILTDNEKSIIRKTEKLLKVQRIEFEKIECKLIENE
jgi:hypothetical protein